MVTLCTAQERRLGPPESLGISMGRSLEGYRAKL